MSNALARRRTHSHTASVSVAGYTATVLADSPGGFWLLNEASGNPQDSSGNGNNVSVVSGSPTYQAVNGQGMHVTAASSQSLSVPSATSLNMADLFTIEAWIRNPADTTTAKGIVSKQSGAGYLRVDNEGTGHNTPVLLRAGVAIVRYGSFKIPASDGIWHHIVGTKNGSTICVYIDGVQNDGAATNSTCVSNSSALTIGSSGSSEYADMDIKWVAYYPSALSSTRVAAHYAAGAGV